MMKYFYAVVHKDADSAFGIEFPDVPGCFSAADREEDIVPNATQALQLWFEDQPDLRPGGLDLAQASATDPGAFLVAVPYWRNVGQMMRVNLSLDRGTLDAIDMAARTRKLTRSAFMTAAARNEIEGRH